MSEETEQVPGMADVDENHITSTEYIENMDLRYRGGFLRQRDSYEMFTPAVEKLKSLTDDYEIVVLFADWCGDARKAVPVLSILESELGIKIRALGKMTKPPYGSKIHWAIPPSPLEVDTFGITSSPTILIFEKASGKEIGRIKTRPHMTKTIEQEIIKIIEDSRIS